ncbi:MAG: hypothetical protein U0892_09930 [Pirellulales bacterium]
MKTQSMLRWVPILLAAAVGCSSSGTTVSETGAGKGSSGASGGKPPQFVLAWSEYPSWSVFGVANEKGLLNKEAGQLGELEKKWNVDVVLNQADYDGCITQYSNSVADAVCITNMDILGPAGKRPAVAVMPTSTSAGADACLAVGIADLDALKSVDTHGLEKSVSQYCFERVLEIEGKNPKDYRFVNLDPAVAAQGMQGGQAEMKSIMVWNPFVLDTLRKQAKAKVLFDSSKIPEEIIDMIVLGQDSLAKPGAERFVHCIAEAFYKVSGMIDDPKTADDTLVALGKEFSNLGAEDMKIVVTQTKFYKSPADALALYESEKFRTKTMPAVVEFCVNHQITEKAPQVSFGAGASELLFNTELLTKMKSGVTPADVK